LILLLVASCARRPETSTEELYRQASLDLRRGNLIAAQSGVDKGSVPWREKPESEWYWKFRILQAEIFVNQGRSKDGLALLDTQPPDSPGFYTLACRSMTVRVKGFLRLGRMDEARTLLDAVESLAARTNQHSITPEIDVLRGSIFDAGRQPAEAEAAFQAGLKHSEELGDQYWHTVSLNNLGMTRIRQFRYDEAIPLFTRAQEGFEKMGAKLYATVTLGNIAICASRLGDFDKAFAAYFKAVEVQEREGAKPYLEASLGEIGSIYTLQGDFAKAIPYYRRALALAIEIGAASNASKWARNLALAFSSVKNWDEAEKFNEQARELKERIHDTDSQIYTRLNSAGIAAGRGQIAAAAGLYEQILKDAAKNPGTLWEAHAALGQLYRETGEKKKAYEHFEAAIRTIEASRAELSLADYRITFLSRLIRFYQDYVDALIDQGAVDRALEVAESSRARVLAEKFRRDKAPQRAPSVESYLDAARRSGTIFLAYWLAPRRSFLWVITPKNRKLFALPAQSEIEELARSYQAVIDGLRDPLESTPPAADRLYDILLAPAQELIPTGSRVVIVPDGVLHNLNFETLPVSAQKPYYWIEDVTLAIAPSLALNPGAFSRDSLKSLLVIGSPEPVGAEYQPLPYAGAEVRNVKQRLVTLEQTIYEGSRAEPSAYRASDPGKYSIIHFAAHASANRESPLESAIILSSSSDSFKLYARDVMKMPLRAELVTISACRGAGARVYSGEGLVGFTWAFLQAGARNVIAGLWDVTDSSTAQLMDHLYEQLNAGKSPAEALREAKLSMIHSGGSFRKPYYWGPFQVYVGGTYGPKKFGN
jgi:CHAT domain-containing protein